MSMKERIEMQGALAVRDVTSWLASVLNDCRRAPALDEPEREAARRCLAWFSALGVSRGV